MEEITKLINNLKTSDNIAKTLEYLSEFLNNSDKYVSYLDYYDLKDSKFFMSLYTHYKSKENSGNQKDLFDKSVNGLKELSKLNNINENTNINNIPFKDVIIDEIKKIIDKSRTAKEDREKECLNMIKTELDLINKFNLSLGNSNNNCDLGSKNKKDSGDNFIKERNLVYLSYFENVKKIIQSLIKIIYVFKINKTDFYQNLNDKIKEIESNNNICLKDIKSYLIFLKELNGFEIDITCFNKDENDYSVFVEFLTILNNREEGIRFVIGKSNKEIRALSEFIGELDDTKIQINDIQDFINVSTFFENKKILNTNNDVDLIQEFKAAFITTPSFANSFNNYLNNFTEIKKVYEEYLDKPEVSRTKIEKILNFSNIEIFYDNESRSIQVKGAYRENTGFNKSFDYDDLQGLYDRALIFTNQALDKMAKNVVENFNEKKKNSENFVNLFEDINQLRNYLLSLYIKGFPDPLKILIQINKSKIVANNQQISDLLEYYKNLRNALENEQTKAYKEKSLIRLIYGHQFYDIYNYFTNKDYKGNIMPLLKKISNNKIKNISREIYYNNILNETNFRNMIEYINVYLDRCFKNNNLKQIDLYKENLIKQKYLNEIKPGFYTWTDDMKLDIKIIKVYKTITGNFPLAIAALLCTNQTNEEEITSFIYRVILCEFRVLFIIMNSDNLDLSNAQYLLWILEELYNNYKDKINSTLFITFTDNNSSLKKELTKLRGHNYFFPSNFINNKDNNNNNNDNNLIEVWSSDATGVGKSTQIQLEAKKNKRNYIYFPIGGVISRKDIINRLIDLKINTQDIKKNYIHIDIYDSNDETSGIIREFLFSLLITRNYSYDEKIFYLDYGIQTVIEIPIGFYDMKDKFKLLEYFVSKKLNLEPLPALLDLENSDNNKITDIQLITNILLMLEKGEIEENVFNLEQNHAKIPIKQCENVINKYFTLPKGNYYQKIAFIRILANQFRKFCCNVYLNPQTLLESKNSKKFINNNNNFRITHVRKIMIENLIKLTLYFIKGPYTKTILNQKSVIKQIYGPLNEKIINQIAIEYLLNKDEERISFEKINPSLVFFNEDIQTFSIITTSKKGEDEYELLLKLYNSQNTEREIPLINYRNLTHEDFLYQVKNVLDLNILSIEQIKNIIGSYCFTSDNFIKMILILLRIRAGIPVIMMGETGCGKTSLIKYYRHY